MAKRVRHRRARRGLRHRSPREGAGRARPGTVTAAPPRSYLGGAALGDALPAGSRRHAGRTGSAPLPRRRAGCQSVGGPGHYPGAAAGPVGAGRGRAVPPGPPLGVWQRGTPAGLVRLRITESARGLRVPHVCGGQWARVSLGIGAPRVRIFPVTALVGRVPAVAHLSPERSMTFPPAALLTWAWTLCPWSSRILMLVPRQSGQACGCPGTTHPQANPHGTAGSAL